ncbi:MAG: biotin transporter BioY [Bacteroidota bacterium]
MNFMQSHSLSLTNDRATAQTFWILTFAILTTIGAQVEIPHNPVPFTLQTFFVLLAGAVLGRRNGFLSMVSYLALGALGMPVFSGAGFGMAKLLGPTGGYLLAFPICAFVVGALTSFRSNFSWILFSMVVGLLVVFLFGTLQLNAVYFHDWKSSFSAGFLIFSWWDVLKLVAAASIAHQFRKGAAA